MRENTNFILTVLKGVTKVCEKWNSLFIITNG